MDDGLRFQCISGCTACCRVTGWVYITEEDSMRAAAYLKIPVAEFESLYVVRTAHVLRLRKPRVGQCFFLDDNGCQIHPAKPTQCRTYPFWPELVEHRENWNEAAQTCPGIGTGPLVQIGAAMEKANEMRLAYPDMYDDSPI